MILPTMNSEELVREKLKDYPMVVSNAEYRHFFFRRELGRSFNTPLYTAVLKTNFSNKRRFQCRLPLAPNNEMNKREKKSYQKLEEEIISLQSRNEKLNFIIENSIDVIWELDKSLKFTYVSPSVYENVGYTQDEWLGHRISEFTTFKEFIKMAREALSAIINFKTFNQTIFETVFFHKNGNPIHFEIVGKVMFNKMGVPIGVMGSTRNITTRKKIEKSLRESEAKLKEINATRDRFFSIIAHDLKSPFNSMLGFSNLLQKKFEVFTPDKQREIIGLINSKLKDTYKLLENLLLWSQSQRGNITYNPEQINLYQVSSEILRLLGPFANDKSIKIINRISQDFSLIGDFNILSTIIRNLLSNAIKFTPKNGRIILNADLKSDESNKEFVEISVIDNGIGIPKETLDSLFTIATHTSSKGTENETGSGLGLSLCKDLLEIHKGDIRVESAVGKGSTFTVTISLNK